MLWKWGTIQIKGPTGFDDSQQLISDCGRFAIVYFLRLSEWNVIGLECLKWRVTWVPFGTRFPCYFDTLGNAIAFTEFVSGKIPCDISIEEQGEYLLPHGTRMCREFEAEHPNMLRK